MHFDPPETTEIQAFVAIVEAGSVAGAARELALPRATVSRRLARLEERLDVRLLQRTTRKQGLTDAGEELFNHARNILAAVRDATDALRRRDGTPRGLLRASLPPGEPRFHAVVTDFVQRYPEVRLEVEWSTRYVDLIAEGFDVALRAGQSDLEPGLIARRLSSIRAMAYASPAYIESRGAPASPDELAAHDCLLGFQQGVRPVTHWPLLDGGSVRVHGRLVTNDVRMTIRACAAGLGIALLPGIRAFTFGDLVPILPEVLGTHGHISIVYAEREFMPAAVRAFVDHLLEAHHGDHLYERPP